MFTDKAINVINEAKYSQKLQYMSHQVLSGSHDCKGNGKEEILEKVH